MSRAAAVLGLVVLVFAACETNPVTGRKSLVLVPESTMRDLGAQAYQEVLAAQPASTDRRMTTIVNRIAGRITEASGEKMAWETTLIDDPQANAFVLPGGKIVVYTGILPICQTEAGLAFVMGHEVGHAVARHGAERMSQYLLADLGLQVADIAFSDNSQRGLIMGALGAGAQVGVLLPFSRAHESDADHTGLIYMARAGYDPRVAPDLWRRMGAGGGAQPPEFLSTHPAHGTRTADLEALMPKALEIYNNAPVRYGVGEVLY